MYNQVTFLEHFNLTYPKLLSYNIFVHHIYIFICFNFYIYNIVHKIFFYHIYVQVLRSTRYTINRLNDEQA